MTYGALGYEPDGEAIQKRKKEREEREKKYLADKARYIRDHKAYLKSQNIAHDKMSDDQILMDMGRLAQNYGTIDSPKNETLKRELTRISQLQDRESRSTLMYYPGVAYDGLKKGGNILGGMASGMGAWATSSYNELLLGSGLDPEGWAYNALKARSTDTLQKLGGKFMEDAAKGGGPVKSLKNVYFPGQSRLDTLRNAFDFIVNGVGEVAPTMIGIAAGGVTGGAAGPVILKAAPRVLQKGAINRALANQIKKNRGTLTPPKYLNLIGP